MALAKPLHRSLRSLAALPPVPKVLPEPETQSSGARCQGAAPEWRRSGSQGSAPHRIPPAPSLYWQQMISTDRCSRGAPQLPLPISISLTDTTNYHVKGENPYR
jgi:hypothetical protein